MNFHFAYHSVNLYCPIQIPCGVKHENCIGTWKFGVMRGLKWSQNPLSVEVVHIREQVFTTSNAIEFSSFLPFNLRNVFPFHLSICHPAFIPITFFPSNFQFTFYLKCYLFASLNSARIEVEWKKNYVRVFFYLVRVAKRMPHNK